MPDWDILILDKSGSMINNKSDIISGFNELVRDQKAQNSTNLFTAITFNNEVELLKEGTFPNVSEIEDDDITVNGMTALLDAIGYVYTIIIKNKIYNNITVSVITDGIENSSKKYTHIQLNDMKAIIDENYKMKMVFIGADISCITENNISSHASQSVNCTGNLRRALRVASRTMSSNRDPDEYIPEGIVDNSTIVPLVIKRSFSKRKSEDSDCLPIVKRCANF